MISKLTRLTDEELAELAFYAGESTSHSDPNYLLSFESLATGSSVLSIVIELQERRKADSEPVATLDVQSGRPDGHKFSLAYSSVAHKLPDDVYFLYRHAQQAPVVPDDVRQALCKMDDEIIAELDAEESARRAAMLNGGMKTIEPTPTAALDDLLSMAASAIEDLLEHTDPNTNYYSGVWADMPSKLRGAMLQASNCRGNSNSSTMRSREHFISLCNEFWNWSEMDLICADEKGYEPSMEWNGTEFTHRVTQALWRMYQVVPTGIPIIS